MNEITKHTVTQEQVEHAVRIVLQWAGDDPSREGLLDTPKRVVKAYGEMFAGYNQDPREILERSFGEIGNFNGIIYSGPTPFHSTCEHHLLPFSGVAHFAYLPKDRVVGLSKMSRLVRCFAKRRQIQERLTSQIADTFNEVFEPRGCGVVLKATHSCMTCRGVEMEDVSMKTAYMVGEFVDDPTLKREFYDLILV